MHFRQSKLAELRILKIGIAKAHSSSPAAKAQRGDSMGRISHCATKNTTGITHP
jgi:hypothetical protein